METLLEELKKIMEPRTGEFEEISDAIWEHPQERYQETYASALQEEYMAKNGFTVTRGIGGIPTAFKAVAGAGKPVIGFLGEYDALSGLSQKADCPEPCPLVPGGPGHGCGHNLLGTGCMEAAASAYAYLKAHAMSGTIIYFGCPAEESGSGKAFLVRAGCFKGVDFCLAWHPGTRIGFMGKSLANVRMIIAFHGKSAHAAGNPEAGRSALDACELTNIGVQYLREHVPSTVRMHSAYLNAGGDAPNVIPAEASLLYALRAPEIEDVQNLVTRVSDVARGAALMTGTTVDLKVVSAYANTLMVPAMAAVMTDILKEIGAPEYTAAEWEYAKQFAQAEPALDTNIYPYDEKKDGKGSTDVGDVSWNVPTVAITMTTIANKVPGHSWYIVAEGKSSIAHKGMHQAALAMAIGAVKICASTSLQEEIRKDFEDAKMGRTYQTLLPADAHPGDF